MAQSSEMFAMPISPFDGCRDRIKRARGHSKTLSDIWESLAEEYLYDSFVDMKSDGTGTISVVPTHHFPEACAFELGEALYQLRSSLDGAIYAAAIVESGKDPPPDENKLEFPICSKRKEFKSSSWKLGPLSQKCRDFIESVQPYAAPELPAELLVRNFNRSLSILNEWGRIDRHRRLHVVASWGSRANPKVFPPEGTNGEGFLENNSEIATFALDGFVPGMQVEANPDLAIDIAIDEIPHPCSDNDTLGKRLEAMITAVSVITREIQSIVDGNR